MRFYAGPAVVEGVVAQLSQHVAPPAPDARLAKDRAAVLVVQRKVRHVAARGKVPDRSEAIDIRPASSPVTPGDAVDDFRALNTWRQSAGLRG